MWNSHITLVAERIALVQIVIVVNAIMSKKISIILFRYRRWNHFFAKIWSGEYRHEPAIEHLETVIMRMGPAMRMVQVTVMVIIQQHQVQALHQLKIHRQYHLVRLEVVRPPLQIQSMQLVSICCQIHRSQLQQNQHLHHLVSIKM